MSGHFSKDSPCGICGEPGGQMVGGVSLCGDHAPIARRLENLQAGKENPNTDLTGRRSKAPRDYYRGGYKRPFAVVPPDSVEQVSRAVKANFHDLPIWGVEALFHRVHSELGRPDIVDWGATLTVKYDSLDDTQYAKLLEFESNLWSLVTFEFGEARIYPLPSERREE